MNKGSKDPVGVHETFYLNLKKLYFFSPALTIKKAGTKTIMSPAFWTAKAGKNFSPALASKKAGTKVVLSPAF